MEGREFTGLPPMLPATTVIGCVATGPGTASLPSCFFVPLAARARVQAKHDRDSGVERAKDDQ